MPHAHPNAPLCLPPTPKQRRRRWGGWHAGDAPDAPTPSQHARDRQAQRNIPSWVLDAAQQFGRYTHQRGALFCFFGKRAIAQVRQQTGQDLSRYDGLHILYSADGASVVTVYRNKRPRRALERSRTPAEQARERARRMARA